MKLMLNVVTANIIDKATGVYRKTPRPYTKPSQVVIHKGKGAAAVAALREEADRYQVYAESIASRIKSRELTGASLIDQIRAENKAQGLRNLADRIATEMGV